MNDGIDNQCAGEPGADLVDELPEGLGFRSGTDRNELSWMPQPRATRYEIARSVRPDFTAGCARQTTKQTYWLDGEAPVLDSAFYYLVRGLEPNGGSWGARSNGTERAVCP